MQKILNVPHQKNLLKLISEFNKVAKYRITIEKSVAILYTNSELSKNEIKNKNE